MGLSFFRKKGVATLLLVVLNSSAFCHAQVVSTVCGGLLPFNLSASVDLQVQGAEDNAEDFLSKIPDWVERECKKALRLHICLYEYAPLAESGLPVCGDACLAARAACAGFVDLTGGQSEAAGHLGECAAPAAAGGGTTSCVGAAPWALAAVSSSSSSSPAAAAAEDHPSYAASAFALLDDPRPPACPEPLVVPDPGVVPGAAHVIEGSECAVPCPGWLGPPPSPSSPLPARLRALRAATLVSALLAAPPAAAALALGLLARRRRRAATLLFQASALLTSVAVAAGAWRAGAGNSDGAAASYLCASNCRAADNAACRWQGALAAAGAAGTAAFGAAHLADLLLRDLLARNSEASCRMPHASFWARARLVRGPSMNPGGRACCWGGRGSGRGHSLGGVPVNTWTCMWSRGGRVVEGCQCAWGVDALCVLLRLLGKPPSRLHGFVARTSQLTEEWKKVRHTPRTQHQRCTAMNEAAAQEAEAARQRTYRRASRSLGMPFFPIAVESFGSWGKSDLWCIRDKAATLAMNWEGKVNKR